MRLLVCGGRDYADARAVDAVLGTVLRHCGITVLIQGGADGADRLACDWARAHGIEVLTFPANWQEHGRAAGPRRNRQMLKEVRPHGVVAFPGGRGTADMVRQARAAGLKVWQIFKSAT
jgi:predicted Rossmann-fold nucleotide-binding protein